MASLIIGIIGIAIGLVMSMIIETKEQIKEMEKGGEGQLCN